MIKMLDFFNLINKKWATYLDVKGYIKCSDEKALYYIKLLEYEAKKRDMYIPKSKDIYVPMSVFIDYFNIDVELQRKYHNSLCEFGYI